MQTSAMAAIQGGQCSFAAGEMRAAMIKTISIGGRYEHNATGSATRSSSSAMALAMIMAAMTAMAAVACSATVIAIAESGPVWADMMIVPPYTLMVAKVLIPSLQSDSCELLAGCSCFAYTGAMQVVVVPPMEMYEMQCTTLVVRLEEIASAATVEFAGTPLTVRHNATHKSSTYNPLKLVIMSTY